MLRIDKSSARLLCRSTFHILHKLFEKYVFLHSFCDYFAVKAKAFNRVITEKKIYLLLQDLIF